jgi:periplasmic divalent cation tolerance protein
MQIELRSDLPPDAVLWLHVTAGSAEEAQRIGRALVEERLAACVHLLQPHTAIYRWKGRIAEQAEHALLAKTTAGRLEALCTRVRALHSYELPGILALPAAGDAAAYLAWIRGETALDKDAVAGPE